MRLPTWLARVLAGEEAVVMMTEGRAFSNTKAKRELGWQLRYPSWRQGFKLGQGLPVGHSDQDLDRRAALSPGPA